MASIRHTVRVRSHVVRTVHVANPDVVNPTRCRRLYDLRLCIERTVHVAQFTGAHATHCARSYDIRLCDVRTEHSAKPDDIETTLGSVAKTDGVHKTLGSVPSWRRAYCAGRETLCRQYDNTSLCTFIRHTSPRGAYCARRETRWRPDDTRLSRETGWRPYDTLCTFIRHYV